MWVAAITSSSNRGGYTTSRLAQEVLLPHRCQRGSPLHFSQVKILVLAGLATGCSFAPNAQSLGTGDAGPPVLIDGDMIDGPGSNVILDARMIDASPCWQWTPTNFDSCTLPAPAPLSVTGALTISTDSPPNTLPSTVLTQSDNSHLLVFHLSSLDISGSLTITGSIPVVFAVDTSATIEGSVATSAGANDTTRCATRAGSPGTASTASDTGGGGGGGAAGADDGGDGTDGTNGNSPNGHGNHGAHGSKITSTLSPLVAGCAGGKGGSTNGNGTPGVGGSGGGAVQISAQQSITIDGVINAAGHGSSVPTAQTGAGGGGSGGAVFLEGGAVTIAASASVCADAGAGGQGGGSSNSGNGGSTSPCSSTAGAVQLTTNLDNFGGTGGTGGFRTTTKGGNAGPASNDSAGGHGAAGGGGGGGVGWIRLRGANSAPTVTGVLTPAPM